MSVIAWIAAMAVCADPVGRPAGPARAPATRPTSAPVVTAARCQETLDRLRRDTGGALRYQNDPPFVIAGDLSAAEMDRIVRHTIRPAADALGRKYFAKRPTAPITILLFGGRASYERYASDLFGDESPPHFGYYRPERRTLIMNIATGTGTLVHEMVHALADFDFPDMPAWFSEGLASLYEQCTLAGGDIRGLVNWRLPALQKAIRGGTLRSLGDLIAADDFRGRLEGLNYAQARYFCMYLQHEDRLVRFYRLFRDGYNADPTGLRYVREALDGRPIDAIDRAFTAWVMMLEAP